ncbi:protein ARV1 isoform X3 [Dermacentor andersoni]|uniref:protein ARV1 isoform X3 n=1 Tax=Dermacentor andersoni TaxID=34620 RepID=UPI002417107E|nr:protein ARV1-like isoform X3 [Dermacentor andersoni]
MKASYACVHCGEMQQQLYRSYGPDLLKLSRCSRCNHVVDEYIEMEFSIVLIDVVLQKLEAYRHIIFNVGMGRPWKIALLFLLGEALEHWMSRQQTHKAGYDLEWHFYIICLFLIARHCWHEPWYWAATESCWHSPPTCGGATAISRSSSSQPSSCSPRCKPVELLLDWDVSRQRPLCLPPTVFSGA